MIARPTLMSPPFFNKSVDPPAGSAKDRHRDRLAPAMYWLAIGTAMPLRITDVATLRRNHSNSSRRCRHPGRHQLSRYRRVDVLGHRKSKRTGPVAASSTMSSLNVKPGIGLSTISSPSAPRSPAAP